MHACTILQDYKQDYSDSCDVLDVQFVKCKCDKEFRMMHCLEHIMFHTRHCSRVCHVLQQCDEC